MYNSNIPSNTQVPSTAKLIKSTVIAAVTAGILLVMVVMPSEYGIDPTGFGAKTGLKRMGEIKVSLAEEAAADSAQKKDVTKTVAVKKPIAVVDTSSKPANNVSIQSHKKTFTLKPDEGVELKVTMAKGAKVDYVWETDGGKVNFDVHGDSKELKIKYHPYYKGSNETKRKGTLEAAFDGGHGWFWRNRTKNSVTITMKTNGEYTAITQY
jgi:hypothetical protein